MRGAETTWAWHDRLSQESSLKAPRLSQGSSLKALRLSQGSSLKDPRLSQGTVWRLKGQSVVFQGLLWGIFEGLLWGIFEGLPCGSTLLELNPILLQVNSESMQDCGKYFGTVSENCSFGIILSHSDCPIGQSEGSLGTIWITLNPP